MSDALDRLQKRVFEMADDEIREALGSPEELREDALEIYREEAVRRGLSMAETPGGDGPAEGEVETGEADEAAASLSRRADRPDAGEFTAADREVECTHCGGKKFLEHQVALPVHGPGGLVSPLPVMVLQCVDCGCLLWFGEPAS